MLTSLLPLLVVGGGFIDIHPAPQARAHLIEIAEQASPQAGTYIDQLVDRARQSLSGSPRDPELATSLLTEAAKAGNSGAMLLLADRYRLADGAPKDLAKALDLIEAAIAAGNIRSGAQSLGDFYRLTEPPYRDLTKAADAYQRGADAGDSWSMIALAEMVRKGEGVTVDYERARALLEKAIAAGDVQNGAQSMGDLYKFASPPFRNPAKAADAYQQAADAGSKWAMIILGDMLRKGDGIPVDYERARKLLESAIAAGDVQNGAQSLGDLYRLADPPFRDPFKAAESYQRAVDAGSSSAMVSLGDMLRKGDGIQADYPTARKLFEAAIAAGNVQNGAQSLGDLYRLADPPFRDPVKAEAAYQQAADAGNSWAMISLATMLRKGDGIPVDYERARKLLEEAIASGDIQNGGQALGDLYRLSDPPFRDPVKALHAYGQAAEAGSTWGMIAEADMLRRGDGITVDYEKAKALLQAAIAAGNARGGAESLGDLYRLAQPPFRDPAQAAAAYQQGADAGSSWSMVALGDMLRKGDGIPKDIERARQLLESAIANGDTSSAGQSLGDLYLSLTPPDLEKASSYYELAASSGNAQAHLAAAKIAIDKYPDPRVRASVVVHYKTAAKLLPPHDVALAMMNLPSASLMAVVQEFLIQAGIKIDKNSIGKGGRQTERAMEIYCNSNHVQECNKSFITFGLLEYLVAN